MSESRKLSDTFLRYKLGLPVQNLVEVISLWISYILLSSLVVLLGDVVHDVVDHLLDLVRLDVYEAWWNLAGCWVLQILQVEWRYETILRDVNHATGLTLREELINAHTQLRAVYQVVSDRSLATNLVTNLYRTRLNLDTELLQLLLQHLVEDVSLRYLTQLWVTVIIVCEMNA